MQHNKYKIVPTNKPKKVAIVGAGFGGLEAALVLKKRGHNPVVFEKDNKMFGLYNTASAMSFKDADKQLIKWYERELKKWDIDVRLNTEIKDINSLFEYTRFGFDRLDYLQDTFLGLVNIEQNKIIKIFTVVNVIFLPPTLIASMYGMNFKVMPELEWEFGYPFSIGLMIVFTLIVLLIFKLKKWL
jgi:magnesium/cobalt transport protein CorA